VGETLALSSSAIFITKKEGEISVNQYVVFENYANSAWRNQHAERLS